MCIEGNDIFDAHMDQILQCLRTVQRLTSVSAGLAAFIQVRHDDVDPSGLAADGGNHPLQIQKMIVRGHMVRFAAHLVGETVIADVDQNIQIFTADRVVDDSLAFPASESRILRADQVVVPGISFKLREGLVPVIPLGPPFYDVIVHLAAELFARLQSNNPEVADRKRFTISLCGCSHSILLYM